MLTYDCVNRETTMAIVDVQPYGYLATRKMGIKVNRAFTTKDVANPIRRGTVAVLYLQQVMCRVAFLPATNPSKVPRLAANDVQLWRGSPRKIGL